MLLISCHVHALFNGSQMKQQVLSNRLGFIKAKDLPKTNSEIACLHTDTLALYI